MKTHNWKIHYERDREDSARNDLRIIDASPESMSHPQGPMTIATVNVRSFAPHVEHAEDHARLLAAAPELFIALKDCLSVMQAELRGLAVIQPEIAQAIAVIKKATSAKIVEDAEIEWAEGEAP